jgi:hypothetical protein
VLQALLIGQKTFMHEKHGHVRSMEIVAAVIDRG